MSFADFVKWLAGAGALGAVQTYVIQILKRFWPELQDRVALAASIVVSAVLTIAASRVIPLLGSLPPEVEMYWPILVWAWTQFWYSMFKARE